MSLADVQKLVKTAENDKTKMINDLAEKGFRREFPKWTDDDMKKWTEDVIQEIQQEASKGETAISVYFDTGSSIFHHDYEQESVDLEKGWVFEKFAGHRWAQREQVRELDNYSCAGFMTDHEARTTLPELFLWKNNVLRHTLNLRFFNGDERVAAKLALSRLNEFLVQTQQALLAYWCIHSDIPAKCVNTDKKFSFGVATSVGLLFDWCSVHPDTDVDPSETKRAREDISEYQKKLNEAIDRLQTQQKRQKK